MTEVMGDWGPWLGIDPVTKKRSVVAEPAGLDRPAHPSGR